MTVQVPRSKNLVKKINDSEVHLVNDEIEL